MNDFPHVSRKPEPHVAGSGMGGGGDLSDAPTALNAATAVTGAGMDFLEAMDTAGWSFAAAGPLREALVAYRADAQAELTVMISGAAGAQHRNAGAYQEEGHGGRTPKAPLSSHIGPQEHPGPDDQPPPVAADESIAAADGLPGEATDSTGDQTLRTEGEMDTSVDDEDDDVSADYAAELVAEEAELAAYETETCEHGVLRSSRDLCQACEDELFDGEHLLYCSRCGMDQGTCRKTRGHCCTGCCHLAIIIREPQAPAPAPGTDSAAQQRRAREQIVHALNSADGARTRDAGYELLYRAEHHCPGGFSPADLLEIARHLGLNLAPGLTPHQVRHQIIEATAGQRADADLRTSLAESHGFPDFASMLATVNALEENERDRYLRKLTWAQYKAWPTS